MKKIYILSIFSICCVGNFVVGSPVKNSHQEEISDKQKTNKHQKKNIRKVLRDRYNKLYNKPIKAMDDEQLRAFATICVELQYFEEAIKALTHFVLTSKNLIAVKEARLEIAEIHFEQGAFKTAGECYTEFIKLYPADQYVEYAQYKAVLSFFECLPTNDRDQKMTEQVIAMADKLLEKDHPFKNDIAQIREFCYRILYEYHEGVFAYYCKKGSYTAASKRLAYIQNKFDEYKISDIEFRTLKLEYQLACAQSDLKNIEGIGAKLALYPGFEPVKFASNQHKKSYVNLF